MAATLYKLTSHYRIKNAINFINKYKYDFGSGDPVGPTGALPNQLYFTFGRGTHWVTHNGDIPVITDTINDCNDLIANIKVMILVQTADMDLATVRYDWDDFATGNLTMTPRDTAKTNSYYDPNNAIFVPFYCINSNHSVPNNLTKDTSFQVFELINLAQHPTNASPFNDTYRPWVPHGTPYGELITDPAGNTWEYLFQLTNYQMDRMKNLDFIPIQYDYVKAATTSIAEFQANRLGAMFVILNAEYTDQEVPYATLPSIQQVGLWSNPEDNAGNRITTSVVDPANVNLNTGQFNNPPDWPQPKGGRLLYIENRPSIYRQPDQKENVQIILEF